MKTIKQAKWLYIICSAFLCLNGLFLMILPDVAAKIVCFTVGAILLLWGATKIIGYFSKDTYFLAFQFDLALGIFISVIGIVMILFSKRIIEFFPFLVGMFILIDGVFKIQTSIDAKAFGLNKWWIILVGALLCGAVALFLMFDTVNGSNFIMIMVGLSLFLDGAQNLFNAIYTIKILRETDISLNKKHMEEDKND